VFPPYTNNFQKPIKFKSTSGNVFFGKEIEKPSEEKPVDKSSEENPVEKPSGDKPSSNPIQRLSLSPKGFIVSIVGEMATNMSFASRGSVRREWRRSGLTRTSTTLPMVYLSLVCRCLGTRRV
jgi:hypothetical protein